MPHNRFFPTFSGLLDPEHKKKIGTAIWEFLWCIDRTTEEREKNGVSWGVVLYGQPIKASKIAEEIGSAERTVLRNLSTLKKHGYIRSKRAPYGEILFVKNSKKFQERDAKSGTTNRETPDLASPDMTNIAGENATFGNSNNNINAYINTAVDDAHACEETADHDFAEQHVDDIADCFMAYRGKPGEPPRASDYKAIQEVLEAGVTKDEAITGIKQAFDNYKSTHSEDGINSMKYCKKIILDNHYAGKQRKEAATNGPSTNQHAGGYGQAQRTGGTSQERTIMAGQVGRHRPGKRA